MIRKRKKGPKQKGLMKHIGAKRRGAGNRGGRGFAGRGKKGKKSKKTRYIVLGQGLGKTKGFVKPRVRKPKSINLSDLMKLVKNGEVKTDYKVLGSGTPLPGIKVIAKSFSNKAKVKIEKVKGQAVVE